IGIDNELVVGADEEVFEMNNGCICCTVRGDLIRIIEGLMRRKGKFDAIILNKIDLVTPAELAEVEARIRAINPYARLHKARKCDVAIADVLERRAFDLDRILDIEPEFLTIDDHDHHDHDHGHHHHGHGLKHYHDEDMQSISARLEGDVDPAKFMPWINQLT